MRPGRLVLSAAGLAAALAACTPAEPAHDVAYYLGHADERTAKLAACQADPGRLAHTPNCVNAVAADGEATSKRFWATPKPAARVQAPSKL